MNEEHLSHLKACFDECDTNATGYIDKDQLRELVTKITTTGLEEEELDSLMKMLDSDNDGKIAFQEFIDGYEMIDPALLIEDADNLEIDEEQIDAILNQTIQDNNNNNNITPSPEDYEKYIKSIYDSFDTDSDGFVNMEQLRAMLEDIKTKSGIEGDDDDINYIVQVLNADGKDAVSFEKFMSAIQHINSPSSDSPEVSSFEPSATTTEPEEEGEINEDLSENEEKELSSFSNLKRAGARGRASSWVAPVSIVNMIKRRTDMFNKEEIQVFTDSADNDPSVVDEFKRKEAMLRSENAHLGSRLNMFEDQLREVRESHEKLSEDNAQLKKSVVIGRKTLVQNQKLSSHNKELEESMEELKRDLAQAIEARNDIQRLNNRLKVDKEAMVAQIEAANAAVTEAQNRVRALEEAALVAGSKVEAAAHTKEVEENAAVSAENAQLREELVRAQEKAADAVKLLTDEYHILKRQSKEDKALLESSNQIIHKLRATLEEQASRTHNSDPNYKFSLLSELEQQVVTRLGTPGTLGDEENTFSPSSIHGIAATPQNTPATPPMAINGRSSNMLRESKEAVETGEGGSWQQRCEEMTLQLCAVEKGKQDAELENAKLLEQIAAMQVSVDETSARLVALGETIGATNTLLEQANHQVETLRAAEAAANERADRLAAENSSLKNQMETSLPPPIDPIHIKAEQTQGELSALKLRVEELANHNNSLLSENSQLKNSYSPSPSPSSSTIDLQQTSNTSSIIDPESAANIEALQSQVTSLTSVKEQMERDLRRYEELSKAPVITVPMNNSLIDELKSANESLKTEGQKMDEKYRVLEYQHVQVNERNTEMSTKINAMQERMESIKNEYETRLSQSGTQSEKTKKIHKENEELKQRLKKYESEDHHIDIIEMEDETRSLKAKLEDAQNKLANERNLNKHLQGQLDTFDRSINVDQTPLISNNAYHNRRQCCGLC
eukprot:gene12604-14792_t